MTLGAEITSNGLLAVEQLAILIHKSPSSVRSDASRNPSALPPICRIPGTKRLLWRVADVEAWLASFVDAPTPLPSIVVDATGAKRGRGRPRKTNAGGRG
jgi:hypothetical protein